MFVPAGGFVRIFWESFLDSILHSPKKSKSLTESNHVRRNLQWLFRISQSVGLGCIGSGRWSVSLDVRQVFVRKKTPDHRKWSSKQWGGVVNHVTSSFYQVYMYIYVMVPMSHSIFHVYLDDLWCLHVTKKLVFQFGDVKLWCKGLLKIDLEHEDLVITGITVDRSSGPVIACHRFFETDLFSWIIFDSIY